MNSSSHPRTAPAGTVVVCTVTYNSSEHLDAWWSALSAVHQDLARSDSDVKLRVIAVDCASTDDSLEKLRGFAAGNAGPALEVIPSAENRGFSGGMNLGLAALSTDDEWLLALNPDALPQPGCIERMVAAFQRYRSAVEPATNPDDFTVGAVTARLVRLSGAGESPQLDACGMRWTRSWRHLDRGSGEPDDGRYQVPEEVFAGSGAGTMYRVEALIDVALPSATKTTTEPSVPQVFDQDFHSFREDAELGLRLQRRGWRCIYEPEAIIEHRRHNLPERRRSMARSINRHSLKNRYLLRILHQSGSNVLRTLPALFRDLLILPYVMLAERSSLSAYSWLWRNRHRLLQRRRWLKERQTADSHALERWFSRKSSPVVVREQTELAAHAEQENDH